MAKIHLQKAIFVNRAPFERLELDFEEDEIAVISSVNGKGKTTILSHIVDSFYELARSNFSTEFEGKENKFYRVSSGIFNLDQTKPSFVYFRFMVDDSYIDYIDIRGKATGEQYDEAVDLEDRIDHSLFADQLEENGCVKYVSSLDNVKEIFAQNILTYFPSYRYEEPGYLNDPYKVSASFSKTMSWAGVLPNPIEVRSDVPKLLNWAMDLVLDMRNPTGDGTIDSRVIAGATFETLKDVISGALQSKFSDERLRLGVSDRKVGASRVSITKEDGTVVYPSLYNLSAGESGLYVIFAELLRQADVLGVGTALTQVSGIVLIDEIDKHLHIKLQKEVLPILLNLFPNIQFITTSHSPFLSMGLAEKSSARTRIIDLPSGLKITPTEHSEYKEVYEMMISENDRFKSLYEAASFKIAENHENTKSLVITEGKTDWKHIKKAMEILEVTDCDVDFLETEENRGDDALEKMLLAFSKVPNNRKIIGIFDRDVEKVVRKIEVADAVFCEYGNNVFGFCIPVPEHRLGSSNIAIEHFYLDRDLKKEKGGKCLYFDNEVEARQSLQTKDRTLIKLDTPETGNPELIKKIIDEHIGALDWIHSKAVFADLVHTDSKFISDFDFSNFTPIFERIRVIINPPAVIEENHAETI